MVKKNNMKVIEREEKIFCYSLYKYWGQCFYFYVSTMCSVPAADYVMSYLVDGWQPVLNYRYGCEFGKLCDMNFYVYL